MSVELFFPADGESGMEEETRSVSGFLHFDTVSKGEHLAWYCELITTQTPLTPSAEGFSRIR